MRFFKNQLGVSLIAAIFIIVVLAFMGVMFVSLINTSSLTAVNDLQSAQALYVAEGGMESAVASLTTPTLGNRIACGTITGNANLTNEPLGQGQFKVTGAFVYSAAATTLNGTITIAATTINVKSTTGYAASGRIMIDRELIDYSGITPGVSTAFTNAVRGRDLTSASTHTNGTRVGQDQCTITSTGGVPTIAAPTTQRQVTAGVQLQEGWAVGAPGAVAAQRPLISRLTQTAWSMYDSTALNINAQLNGISMLSYADGWAVGAISAGKATIFRWNGSNWTNMAASVPATANQNLNSISMVSSTDGFAVGNLLVSNCSGTNLPEILRWNGAAWNCVASPAEDANHTTNLVAVVMLDTNNDGSAEDGWAFGPNGWSTQLRWNIPCVGGAGLNQWNECSGNNFASGGFNAVSMVTSTYGWAVGNIGPSLGGIGECAVGLPALGNLDFAANGNWNWVCPAIATWPVNAARAANLMGVFMISFTDGWAVGAVQPTSGGRPTILRWDTPCGGGAVTGQWNDCTNATYVPAINQQLNSVYCVDANDCWAVGDAGWILHWGGSPPWTQVQAGLTASNLRGVSVIGPEQQPKASWQDLVN